MSCCGYSTISPKIVRIYISEWTSFASDAHLLVTRLFGGLPSLEETGKVWNAMESGCFSRLDSQTHLVSVSISCSPDGTSGQKVSRVSAEDQPLRAPSEVFSLCFGGSNNSTSPKCSAMTAFCIPVCDQTAVRELERGLYYSQGVPTRYTEDRCKVSLPVTCNQDLIQKASCEHGKKKTENVNVTT